MNLAGGDGYIGPSFPLPLQSPSPRKLPLLKFSNDRGDGDVKRLGLGSQLLSGLLHERISETASFLASVNLSCLVSCGFRSVFHLNRRA